MIQNEDARTSMIPNEVLRKSLIQTGAIITLESNGALYIGDPHSSSRKPGTRNDGNFILTVIGKLEQAIEIANQKRLIPIILGDLFDRENDADGQAGRLMLTLLFRALVRSWTKPFVLAGNHDKSGADLTDNTTLAAIAAAGVIRVVSLSELFLIYTTPGNERVAVGGTPHGRNIPNNVRDAIAEVGEKIDKVVWITHEDMAFEGAYPGSLEFFEIKGCDAVVNGHMHLTKRPVTCGMTVWNNPGNITRQSKDCVDHVPSVWEMAQGTELVRIPLNYTKDVFDAVLNFVAMDKNGVDPVSIDSVFVEMLKTVSAPETKTEDGSLLLVDINTACKELEASEDATNILLTLHGMACG